MADYISREAAVKIAQEYGFVRGNFEFGHTLHSAAADCIAIKIEGIPAADVEPVRRGKWNIRVSDKRTLCLECSVCGRRVDNFGLHRLLIFREYEVACGRYPYCHCGCKMDLEVENDG